MSANRTTFLKRFGAILAKEFVQMRRDRLTFGMMIGVPIMQLILFGYAINGDPRSLPTAVVATEASAFSRSLLAALDNTGYFAIDPVPYTAAEAQTRINEAFSGLGDELGDVGQAIQRAQCAADGQPYQDHRQGAETGQHGQGVGQLLPQVGGVGLVSGECQQLPVCG